MVKNRISPRHPTHDYTSPWGYFVTIVTKDRRHCFGEVMDGSMLLNELGIRCETEIQRIESSRKNIEIHKYIVMPNHIHMIVVLGNWNRDRNDPNIKTNRRDVSKIRPERENQIWTKKSIKTGDGFLNHPYDGPTLWNIVKLFKWNVTKYARHHDISFARQSRYHDRIIRDHSEYERIMHYILTNPQNRNNDSLS